MNDKFSLLVILLQKYCGKKSEIGQAVGRLKKVFYTAKTECLPGLEELLGESPLTSAPSECSSLDTNDGLWSFYVHPVNIVL